MKVLDSRHVVNHIVAPRNDLLSQPAHPSSLENNAGSLCRDNECIDLALACPLLSI
jgi:hypothetical protein